jgi:hypothetical protein
MPIHGFDPLGTLDEGVNKDHVGPFDQILDEAVKSTVINILKSYTGFYDLFSETIQNSLDAIQKKRQTIIDDSYQPKIWINVDIQNQVVRVADNGMGMNTDEFLLCFRPNVSFKREDHLRGNKGVGATFLAYGYNYVHLQSKRGVSGHSAILRSGRQWADDQTGKINRPKFEESDFDAPELENEDSGTVLEIRLTGHGNEKPKDLGWQGATTARQWFDILRVVTPLGGTYFKTPPFKPLIDIRVTDRSGTLTQELSDNAEYYYPHEIPGLKVADLTELRDAIRGIEGDPQTIQTKLPDKYQNLDCLYEIWKHEELLEPTPPLKLSLTDEQRTLIERHKMILYAAHIDSVKTFDAFNEKLGLRKNVQVMRGGLQLASDFLPQGDLLIIPLKRFVHFQRTTHVIVHFTQGSPDLGRKTFQPELRELAEILAVSATNCFVQYQTRLKPDTGAIKELTPDKQLHVWKRSQEDWRDQNPLLSEAIAPHIAYMSIPREEQDVVALYHELIGAGVIRGIKFYGSTSNDRYDALIEINYTSLEDHLFEKDKNPLGARSDITLPHESEPKVLEYKYDFDALLRDLDSGIKFAEHISLVVCWQASGYFSRKIFLKPFLLEELSNNRIFFGSTHSAYFIGQSSKPVFEVVILEDLYNFLLNPEEERARQKVKYENP